MKKIWKVVITTAMIAALVSGCGNSNSAANENAEAISEQAAEKQDENVIEAWGSVDAQTIKQIYLDFPATITKIYVNVGQEIDEGEKLLSIDYADYKTSIQKQETELSLDKISAEGSTTSTSGNASQIEVLQKKAAVLSQNLANGTDSEINAQQNIIDKAQSDLVQKQKKLDLEKQLLDEGASSEESVNEINLEIKDLNNQIKVAKDNITELKKSKNIELSDLKSQIAVLNDQINSANQATTTANDTYSVKEKLANIDIKQMKEKYDKAFIKGNDIISTIPKSVVKTVNVVEGSKAGNTEGGTAIMELIDEESLVIKANVSEDFIKDVKIGSNVKIIPYADREAVFKGKVKDIQKMAISDNGEVVVPVIIEATEKSPYLSYGYSVDVEIDK